MYFLHCIDSRPFLVFGPSASTINLPQRRIEMTSPEATRADAADLFNLRQKMRRKFCFHKQDCTARLHEDVADRSADNALCHEGAEKVPV